MTAGADRIRRGIGIALSGTKTLIQNRQLLWFTLLAGLVLAGNVIVQGVLGYITWTMIPICETEWVVLTLYHRVPDRVLPRVPADGPCLEHLVKERRSCVVL